MIRREEAVEEAAAGFRLADLPIRDDLRGKTPYGAPQLDVPYALNTNENPYAPSEELAAALARGVADVARGLNRYPDRDATRLRAALATYLGHDLDVREVWAANGSNEVLQQILQVFGGAGRTAMGFEPSYSMHPIITGVTGTEWVSVPRAADFTIDLDAAKDAIARHRPDIVFLTSPNNPTGTALPLEVIREVAAVAPGMVVVDEAYAEFRRENTPSALSLLPDHPRLIVSRTMSKAFAMAGARLGYLAANPAVIDALQLVRLPYHLSAVSQIVALTALEFSDELLGAVKQLRGERDALVAWLRDHGFTVADSDANFVMFGEFTDRAAVWRGLLDHGVLIREVGPAGWLRVTVGTPEEMSAFRDALLRVTADLPAAREQHDETAGPGASGSPGA
ncbi:histidinol-phosphate transaminase [Nocardiopsis gilva YIM 90087]|uniref:Histidinol-phosphate aminotransferase n=1 Tax=Nocardiopsis gilva YIM 90087 TaxID=1235441 RepID=A0A223S5S5_9ACTN|nr:histidinol-phosphate transaminase [Nocardiopsis gilva YIM 90087]